MSALEILAPSLLVYLMLVLSICLALAFVLIVANIHVNCKRKELRREEERLLKWQYENDKLERELLKKF